MSVLIASLGMYDPPQLAAANDALWEAIARRLRAGGVAAPERLIRDQALDKIWLAPDLLLAQTCGYPLTTRLAGRVRLVATPAYAVEGCDGAWRRSAVIVRRNDPAADLRDLRGRPCAINSLDSDSGMNLLRAETAPLARAGRFFGALVETGAHLASAETLATGGADVAAIDAVTWEQIQRFQPHLSGALRVLQWTAATPGLPLITARATDVATLKALRRALLDVARDPALRQVRSALRLTGFHLIPPSRYRAVTRLRQEAMDAGYPALC